MTDQKGVVSRPLLVAVGRSLQSRLKVPVLDFDAGVISLDEAASRVLAAFIEGHANAAFAGRALNAVDHPIDDADRALGRVVAIEQAQYFEKFLEQVAAGKYHDDQGALREDAIEARTGLYTARLRGTANDSWALSLPAEDLIHWRCDDSEVSCSVCPSLAADGPYKASELPTTPGANETPCLFNCNCYLESEAGSQGFKNFVPLLKSVSGTFAPDSPIIDPFFALRKGRSCSCSKKL